VQPIAETAFARGAIGLTGMIAVKTADTVVRQPIPSAQ